MDDEVAAADNGELEKSLAIERRRRPSIIFSRRRLSRDNAAFVDDNKTVELCNEARIETQITRLITEMRVLEARRLVLAAIAADGQTSFLLQRLAKIEEILGNYDSAVKYLTDALTLTPEDPEVLFEHSRALYKAGRYGEARNAIYKLTPYQRQNPQIRSILGATYRAIGWHAHAVEAYGSVFRLPWRSAYSRLVSWLACGTPISIRRSDAWTFECMVEDHYTEESTKRRGFLTGLHFPSESEGQRVIDDLDTFLIRDLTIRLRLQFLSARNVGRPALIGCLGFAWLIAFVAFYAIYKSELGLTAAAFTAIVYAEVTLPINIGITKVIRESALRGRLPVNPRYFWLLLILAVLELWINGPTLLAFLWVLVADVAGTSAIWMSPIYNYYYIRSSLLRDNLRWFLAGEFLDLLFEVSKLGRESRNRERAQWMSRLSQVAWILEGGYANHFGRQDRTIRAQIGIQAQKAASFARMIASSIAIPEKITWKHVVSDLKSGALAAISDDIGSLAPREGVHRVEAIPRLGGRVPKILKVAVGLGVLGASIGILWWSKDRQDVGLAIVAVITAVATTLTGLLLGSARGKSDIGSG